MIDCCMARPGLRDRRSPVGIGARAFLAALMALAANFATAQVAVSEAGQATYTQPIAVPPGIAGMQPNLSFSYVQGGINGPLGAGWSVQGLSSITRCPATLATDGRRSGVRYAPVDKICIDGQRLLQTDENGNPSAAANATGIPVAGQSDDARGLPAGSYREFRTEKDTFVRVRAYGSAGGADANGPALFRVWTKAGQIYDYGDPGNGAPSALITAQGKSVVVAWPVAAIREAATANRIDFRYEVRDTAWGSGPTANSPLPGREWNIQEIAYGGNKVIFTYSDRSSSTAGVPHDAAETYHEGSKMVSVRRLDAISTYIGTPGIATPGPGSGIAAKTYKLAYVQGLLTGSSRVTSLRECAGGPSSTRCLPAAAFTYYSGVSDNYQASTGFNLATLTLYSTAGTYGVLQGDWNGDGKTDLIRWSDNPAENQLYVSNGDGSFTRSTAFNITDQNLFKSNGCYTTMLVDMDGDGSSDLLRYAGPATPDGTACPGAGTSVLYSGQGDGSFVARSISGVTLERQMSVSTTGCADGSTPQNGRCANGQALMVGWTRGSGFYILDVDGDSKADIVTALLPAQAPAATYTDPCLNVVCTRVYRGDGQGNFTEIASTNVAHAHFYSSASAGGGRLQPVVDLDGDSLADFTDIVNHYATQYTSWRSRGDGNFDPFPFVRHCAFPIDFNGDQRPDCLQTPSVTAAGNALKVSTGAASEQPVAGFNLNGAGNELEGAGVGFLVVDFNNDGRQDILRWKDDPAQNQVWWSNGDGTFRPSGAFNLKSTVLKAGDGSFDIIVGDFTGRGHVEILRMAAGAASSTTAATQNQLFVKAGWVPNDGLLQIVLPGGATTQLTHALLLNPASAGYVGRYRSDRGTAQAARASLGMADLAVPMPVVVTQVSDSGVGSATVQTEFAYAGLKTDLNGRGTVGFREVRRQSPGPNGEALTVITQYVQKYPYIGVAASTETRKGTLFEDGARLSLANYRYCEAGATQAQRDAATVEAPCDLGTARPRIAQPHLLSSTEQGWENLTGTPLPSVVTTNTVNRYGDTTAVRAETTGSVAGTTQTFVKAVASSFCEPNTANCPNTTAGDNWILGRVERATVQQSAPDALGALTAPTPLALSVVPGTLSLSSATPGATVSGAVTANGSGGVPPYRFTWERTSGSRISVSGSQLATFSATVNVADDFTENFQVRLTDGANATTTAGVSVSARGPAFPPLTLTVSPTSFGTSATLTATISGGVAPFTYTWSKSGQASFAATASPNVVTASMPKPPACESFAGTVSVQVRDAAGQVKTAGASGFRSTPQTPGKPCP